MAKKFATAINCIDGRVQAPVIDFIRNNYDVYYVDMITTPGPDKLLSEYKDTHEIKSIKKKVWISYKKHDSELIFLVGHYDCAGNSCSEESHLQQIRKAMQNIKEWKTNSEFYGLWVDKKRKAFLIK
ncbi:carbonic anhydrase [Candidatus Omnitrophota bacterium]